MADDAPRDEGTPEPVEVVDDELVDPEDTSTSGGDDTTAGEPEGEKTVPYSRFKEVNDKLKDTEVKYAAATAPKDPPPEKEEASKKVYSDEQRDTIKDLAGTSALQKRLDEQDERWEAKEKQEQRVADDRDRINAVKDEKLNSHGFTEEQVQKQVVKWGNSKDPDKQWLAAASYTRVIREMNELFDAREAKKGEAPPKVEKSGSGDDSPRNPDVKNDPNATNPLKYKRSLGLEAVEFMKGLDGGE